MSKNDTTPEQIPEFTLEDIMREFGNGEQNPDTPADSLGNTQVFPPVTQAVLQSVQVQPPQAELPLAPDAEVPAEEAEQPTEAEEAPVEAEESPAEETAPAELQLEQTQVFTPVTIEDLLAQPEAPVQEKSAVPVAEAVPPEAEEPPAEIPPVEEPAEEPAPAAEEPVPEEAPSEEGPAAKPLQFRSKLSELRRKLVAGPERRFYDLTEKGLGRVQIAIFLNILIVVLCAGGTVLYDMGAVMENRLRLMVFSQILAMMISATLGCYVLLDGLLDLVTGKFSLNSMLFLTLGACAADAVFCLQELRVPCCAAFCLEMTFALWDRYMRRSTEISQMDILRKATRLDGLVRVKGYFGEEDGLVRTEGKLEDFMDHYTKPSTPEKVLNIYSIVSILACTGIAVLAGTRHGLSLAIQVFSTSMLVAVPAVAFISQSRPTALLQRRLRMVGTVFCGWKGVKTLCGKASFPLRDRDIFPLGSVKLNGVKFLGDMDPDLVIASAAALMRENGGSLEPVLTQLLKSRNGFVYMAEEVQILPAGVSGFVKGSHCLLGLKECLQDQGVEIPESALVDQAIYFAADGQLTAVFAMNYARTKASAAGLVTLGGYRKIRPMILADNFMITPKLLKDKFGVKTRRYDFPDRELRADLSAFDPDPELIAGALTTQQNLSATAYAVTGARALRNTCRLGMWLSLAVGILGLLIMAALAYLGATHLLSPMNVLLYQAIWLIPGLLFADMARFV